MNQNRDDGESAYREIPIRGERDQTGETASMFGKKSPGKSPWNYLTAEDLQQAGGRDLSGFRLDRQETDSGEGQYVRSGDLRPLNVQERKRARRGQAGRLRDQTKAPADRDMTDREIAFREKILGGEIPRDAYARRVMYTRRWAKELVELAAGHGSEPAAGFEPGQPSLEEGYRILKRFGETAPDGFSLSGYREEEIRDLVRYYVILSDLPRRYVAEAFADEISADERIMALLLFREAEDDQLYGAISEFGRYRGDKSRFFEEREKEMKQVIARVYRAWAEAYEQKAGRPLADELIGESDTRPWYPDEYFFWMNWSRPFREPDSDRKDIVFLVDPLLVYWRRRGRWTITQYFPQVYGSKTRRAQLGQMCRETERLMRKAEGYRKLKEAELDEDLRNLVSETVSAYVREKKKASRPHLVLNLGQLGAIRSDADDTLDKLLTGTEEEELEFVAPSRGELPGTSPQAQPLGLTAQEGEVLRLLFAGEDPKPYLRHRKLLSSILADSINEKLFDEIGDSVVEEEGGQLSLVEDYREDLRKLLGDPL